MRLAGFDCEHIPLHGVAVLVIDDEADARDLIKQVLVQCGAAVVTASLPMRACNYYRRCGPMSLSVT